MGYYGKGWNYATIQNSDKKELVEYFLEIMRDEYNNRYTTKNVCETYERILKEKTEIEKDFLEITRIKESLKGTADGLAAQMKYDMLAYSMYTYTDKELCNLESLIQTIYQTKIQKISNKINKEEKVSVKDAEFYRLVTTSEAPVQELMQALSKLNISLPGVDTLRLLGKY